MARTLQTSTLICRARGWQWFVPVPKVRVNPSPIHQRYARTHEFFPTGKQKGEPRKPCCDLFFLSLSPSDQSPSQISRQRFSVSRGLLANQLQPSRMPEGLIPFHNPHLPLLTFTSSISDDLRVLHVQQVHLPFHSQGAAGIRIPHPCRGHIRHPHHHGHCSGLPCPHQSHFEDRALSRHHNLTSFTLVPGVTYRTTHQVYTGQVGFRDQDTGNIPE